MESLFKCIVVTPAGRKEYLEILVKHLEKQKKDFDEWHLWKNTTHPSDIEYLYQLEKEYSWIKVIDVPNSDPNRKNDNIHLFFNTTINENTIYIRLDDDIIWLDNQFIKKLYQARIEHPNYFLVFPQIINNGIITHIQQQKGVFKYHGDVEYACLGNLWKDKAISLSLHEQFLKAIETNSIDEWRRCFKEWEVVNYDRISINSFAFFGKTFSKITVDTDEEHWLTHVYPRENKHTNLIIGDPLCVHYAFYTQRDYLNSHPTILSKYKELSMNL